MKTPILPTIIAAFATTALLLPVCVTTTRATVLPISDASYTGNYTAGNPENITGDTTVAGVTTTEGTFTGLFGATANNATSSQVNNSVGTVPASVAAAVSGLSANDGANNFTAGNFQFSLGTFTNNTRFFIIESAPATGTAGDPTTVTLINSANAQVGTYTLNIAATSFTTTAANTTNTALATLTYTSAVASLQGQVSKLGGVTFSLADFTGTGDLSTVTGIAINGNNQLDPNVVGAFNTAAVPEPSTLAFSVAGLTLLAARLRLRRRTV